MSADIEVIAKAWMAHQGYSPDDIEVAETDTHEARGCDWHGTSWYCFDEYGNSNHPAWDVLEEATEMARVAIEALGQSYAIVELPKPDGTGKWKSSRGTIDDGYITWSVGVNGIPYARAHRGPGDASRAVADHIAFAAAILAATAASEVAS